MIRKVTVKRFRAFEDVTVELDPGTTFIVAANGVGKTSIMQAVRWALFGAAADPKAFIRGDGPAEVTVELDVTPTITATITRTQAHRGRPTVGATVDGTDIEDLDELAAVLQRHWQAAPEHLARLCFLEEHSVARRDELAPGLEPHLHAIFGLGRLREDLERARAELRSADEAAKLVKKAAARPTPEREEDEVRLDDIERQLDDLRTRRPDVERDQAELREQLRIAEEWQLYEQARERRNDQIAQVLDRMREADIDVPNEDVDESVLRGVLTRRVNALEDQFQERSHRIGLLTGRLAAVDEALGQLEGTDADCPVCLRPLTDADRHRASAAHQRNREDLQAELEQLQSDESLHREIERVRALRRSLDELPQAAQPHQRPNIPIDETTSRQSELDGTYSDLTRQLVELQETALQIRSRLKRDAETKEAEQALRSAYRRVALAQVTVAAFEKTIAAVERQKVTPLREAIEGRWKVLMGGISNLRWEPGRVQLRHGHLDVDYENFSGGERTIATVLTQTLVIAASTRAEFLWLDEPLEHLDPDHRRMVAAALTQATAEDALRQIVVTTYEEPLVRRLAQSTGAKVYYLRPST